MRAFEVLVLVQNKCIVALMLATAIAPQAALAQFTSSYRSTVSNSSTNSFQPGSTVAIKYRGSVISSPNSRQDSASAGNFTRHSRLGNSTGIGGSSFQTTSVTSETRPAFIRPLSISTGTPLINRPQLNLQFGAASTSPALQTFKPLYPDAGSEDLFGRGTESFTTFGGGSSALRNSNSFAAPGEQFQFGQ